LNALREQLASKGLRLHITEEAVQKLSDLRMLYEPYAQGIARNLFIILPPWIRHDGVRDNWRAGPWDRMIQAQALGKITPERRHLEEHF
jgi:hypothetical protein